MFSLRLLLFFVTLAQSASAQAATVFHGMPSVKISEAEIDRVPETLGRKEAESFRCLISKIGENYYWATRDNTQMVRIETGVFVTYVAINGSGYVRVLPKAGKPAAVLAGAKTEEVFDYVEHLLLGLRSVTYYGTLKQ